MGSLLWSDVFYGYPQIDLDAYETVGLLRNTCVYVYNYMNFREQQGEKNVLWCIMYYIYIYIYILLSLILFGLFSHGDYVIIPLSPT